VRKLNVLIFALISLGFSVQAMSAWTGEVTIEGKVKSFDEKEVRLVDKGKEFRVPRSSFPKNQPLTSGQHVTTKLKMDLNEKIYAAQK
jgi:hypothetical protein